MARIHEISEVDFQALLTRYRSALDALLDVKTAVKQPPTVSQLLEALLARDAIRLALPAHRPHASQLLSLQALDDSLAAFQSEIANSRELTTWRQRLSIDPAADWWPLPAAPQRSWWAKQDWLWNMGSIVFLTASASLILSTASRFWGGGIASAGTLAVVTQSVLALVTAKGALTESGRSAWEGLLKKLGINKGHWQEWSCAASFLVLLIVGSIHTALPSMAHWYNDWGRTHYEARQLGSALNDYQTALSLRPDFPEAHFNLGLLYEDLQQTSEAQAAYQFVVTSDPEDVALDIWLSAHNNLARLQLLEGELQAAAPLLIRALNRVDSDLAATDFDVADANYALLKNLSWVRLKQESYRAAQTRAEEALAFEQTVLVNFPEEAGVNRAAAYCLQAQILDAQAQLQAASAAWQECLQRANRGNVDEDGWLGVYERREQGEGE